ncbi:alpha/beta fold hydrolase [Longispora albida]|uniref:alpha/beta fold hydrolase n=1 Tax=Longispora albida TaxID=203523 RepID=UPI000475F25F|nr:alpha/beta fold hydrolase [Longispora albida]
MPLLRVNDTSLNYTVEGQGEPVVLLHSALCDLTMWDEVAEALASQYTVIRYDMRGWGHSGVPAGPFRHHEDLAALLDALGHEGPIRIAGNSFGGRIAAKFAMAYPERVEKLVLLAAAAEGHNWSDQIRAYGAAEGAALEAGDFDKAVEINLETWFLPGTPRNLESLRTGLVNQNAGEEHEQEGPEWDLGAIKAQVLVGYAVHDLPDFEVIARRYAEIPGARLVSFPESGHLIPLDDPQKTIEVLRAFL